MPAAPETIAVVKSLVGETTTSEFRADTRIEVPAAELLAVMTALRSERQFDLLVDVTCVDYLNYRGAKNRFGLVYLVASTHSNERLTVRVFIDEPNLRVPSLFSLWSGAEWMEREVYDMFGVEFVGHPDLRRILMPEEFTEFPLRKDYPMQGRGERHNFERITRAEA